MPRHFAKPTRTIRFLLCFQLISILLVPTSSFSAAAFPTNTAVDIQIDAPGVGDILVMDMDRDGWNDILHLDEGGNITIRFQDPMNTEFPFNETTTVNSPSTKGMAVGFLDTDTIPDIASFSDDVLTLNFQHPAREFIKTEINLPFAPNALKIGDLNGDSEDDIVLLSNEDILVLFHNPTLHSYYGLADSYWDTVGGQDLVLGDFGGSKGLDIAISTPKQVDIIIQGMDGLKHNRTIPLVGNFTSSIVGSGYFDSDRYEDLVILRSDEGKNDTLDIYAQNIQRDFTHMLSIENDDFGEDFGIGDLNDDDHSDIALVSDYGCSIMVYLKRESYPEFSVFSLGNDSYSSTRIALGKLNWDPYTDIVLRTPNGLRIFLQDDFPPFATNQIPSRLYFNENTVADNFIKLDDYIKDDHTVLQYAVIYESDPELLHAVVDGSYLDFYPKENWVGTAKFQVAGWYGDYVVHSNKFIVGVNDVPDVQSQPLTRAKVGEEYVYQIIVEDTFPLDDRVRFDLVWGPREMEINPYTGLLTWTPQRKGEYKVAVIIEDQYGGKVEHCFVIKVVEEDVFPTAMVTGLAGVLIVFVLLSGIFLWNENALFGLLMLFVPLYTKLKRDKILDHFVRGKIYGYILANPGEHYNAIREALNLTNGSLAYHLRTLEREGFIKSKKFGVYRRFYPMNMKIPDEAHMVNEIQKMIMAIIKKNPGISQKEIATYINLTPPTVNYHMGVLSRLGLVEVTRKGRKTQCYLKV